MRIAMIGLLALAGCAATAEMQASEKAEAAKELASALGDRTPGTPRDCISTSDSDSPQIIDDHTVLYKPVGRTLWRNDLASSCPGLRPYTTMIVEVHGSQLCRNDRFRVIEPGTTIPSAYCVFGQFTPYEKAR
jgi:hypothetical protein